MIRAPERNALQIDWKRFMIGKMMASVSGIERSDDGAGPQAEGDDAHRHDDADGLPQRRS